MPLSSETERKLRIMKLGDLVALVNEQALDVGAYGLGFEERFDMLTDSLYELRNGKKVRSLIRKAHFKWPEAEISSMYFLPERGLEKQMFLNLLSCTFIDVGKNIVMYGPTGDGKSYAACAVGKAACKKCRKVRYVRFPTLCDEFASKETPEEKRKLMRKYVGYDLLIIDEWLNKEMTDDDVSFMFDLVDEKEEKSPFVFCSQYPPAEWLPRLGGGPKAESIVDKFAYDTLVIRFNDFNMRDYMARHNPKRWC